MDGTRLVDDSLSLDFHDISSFLISEVNGVRIAEIQGRMHHTTGWNSEMSTLCSSQPGGDPGHWDVCRRILNDLNAN